MYKKELPRKKTSVHVVNNQKSLPGSFAIKTFHSKKGCLDKKGKRKKKKDVQ
jgi:hypothetical protein